MIKNCSYFGVMAGKPVGSTVNCPLCTASVTAIKRNGYAYAPPHEPNYHPDTYIGRQKVAKNGTY